MNLKKYPCMSILDFSREEMIEIHYSLRRRSWHKLLGKKPKWWTNEECGKEKSDLELCRKKREHVEGAVRTLEDIIGEKDIAMHRHINMFNGSKMSFYYHWYIERHLPDWWIQRL